MDSFISFVLLVLVIKCKVFFSEETGKGICTSLLNFFFYRYIITHTFKQDKNTITRYKYIWSTWEKHIEIPN